MTPIMIRDRFPLPGNFDPFNRMHVSLLLAQRASLIRLADNLADILRQLYDLQNGPPLPKYEDDWRLAMARAAAALRFVEDGMNAEGPTS